LEDVDDFYNKKYEDAARRLKLLQDRYGKPLDILQDLDKDEVEDLMGALLELRGQLRKLQWYGEVNRRGFIKITKKFDKKIAQVASQRPYLDLKVDPKEFATKSNLLETMKIVNDWLSVVGECKSIETNGAAYSSRPIHRVSTKAMPSFPKEWIDTLNRAISDDDAQALRDLFEAHGSLGASWSIPGTTLALHVLPRAISCRSKACINTLFGYIDTLDEYDEINQRNFIHRLVITLGRSALASDKDALSESPPMLENFLTPTPSPALVALAGRLKDSNGLSRFGNEEETVSFLKYLLDCLRPHQRNVLRGKDVYGRMPLHYAAQYGLVLICQLIIVRMHDGDQFEKTSGVETPFWQDLEGYTPLHLSVIGGHPLTTKALLVAKDTKISDGASTLRHHMANSGEVLALATKANFTHIVKLLVEAGVDLNYQDDQGESAIHIAARFNHAACARVLITGSGSQRANIELTERAFGWTPLFLSCVDGHLEMVEILVAAGANLDKVDTSGWTAKEHAALRGHANIWRALAKATPELKISNSASAFDCRSPTPRISPAPDRPSNESTNGGNRFMTPVKTFGHRYLTKESMILVTLGSTDTRKAVDAVHLDRVPMSDIHPTQLDTALSLVVSAGGANGEPSITDLPVQDSLNTEPIIFMAADAAKVKLFFDIVPTYAGSSDKVIGRGVALLSSIKPSIGSQRISLQGDVTVPIIAATTLDVIGTVNFNFLVITPFTHPNMTINEHQTYWKSMASTMVIGHRGDLILLNHIWGALLTYAKVWVRTWQREGLCSWVRTPFKLAIPTSIKTPSCSQQQSFIAAANLGASYVEVSDVTPRSIITHTLNPISLVWQMLQQS
jgi:glycerophosphodiester phosphodiesterase